MPRATRIGPKLLRARVGDPTITDATLARECAGLTVREGGLEPPRPKTLEPKSSASANSATRARAHDTAAAPTAPFTDRSSQMWECSHRVVRRVVALHPRVDVDVVARRFRILCDVPQVLHKSA